MTKNFLPFSLSAHAVSAAAGGTISTQIAFSPPFQGLVYKTLLSATGTGPTVYGVSIPLTQDQYTLHSYHGIYPVTQSGMHGTLDSRGAASGSFTIPAGLPTSMIGSIFYLAAIAEPAGGIPVISSIYASLTIVP